MAPGADRFTTSQKPVAYQSDGGNGGTRVRQAKAFCYGRAVRRARPFSYRRSSAITQGTPRGLLNFG